MYFFHALFFEITVFSGSSLLWIEIWQESKRSAYNFKSQTMRNLPHLEVPSLISVQFSVMHVIKSVLCDLYCYINGICTPLVEHVKPKPAYLLFIALHFQFVTFFLDVLNIAYAFGALSMKTWYSLVCFMFYTYGSCVTYVVKWAAITKLSCIWTANFRTQLLSGNFRSVYE